MKQPSAIWMFLKWGTIFRSAIVWLCLVGLWYFEASESEPDFSPFYSGLLGLLSIASGFIASFYFFVISRGTNFLKEIEKTDTFKALLRLTSFTLLFALWMIVVTFFLSVLEPIATGYCKLDHALNAFWLYLIFLTAMNFRRCMSIFLRISS